MGIRLKNNADYYIAKWLKDYHNTTPNDVARLHPIEAENGEWWHLYPVTKEQYDEWYKWAFKEIKKDTRLKNAEILRSFIWLNIAPSVIN